MVSLNRNVQSLLGRYIANYVDFRRRGEYGISSFWNWYYQVRNYIYQLDCSDSPIGDYLLYTMPIWGTIEFSRRIIGGEVYVLVTNLRINRINFLNWIRYNRLPPRISTPSPIQSISSWTIDNRYEPYNGIYVVVSNNGLYSLADKQEKLKIGTWFDTITFPLIKKIEGIDTIGQGTASHFNYLITPNLDVLHPAEVAIRNRRKLENRIPQIVMEVLNQYLRHNLILN